MKKPFRLLAVAASAAFFIGSAQAQQGTVTQHAFAIGKGAGITGYASLLCAAGQIPLGQSSADPQCVTPSQDCTISASGVFTCTKTNNVSFGPFATQAAGSNHSVPVTVGGTPTAKVVPDCQDTTGNHLNYTQSSDSFSCGNTSSGAGGSSTIVQPQGRLTLVSGQPEITADVVGAQNLYYAPDTGNSCPIYNGTTWTNYTFTASATDQVGLTLALGGSANWPANTIFDVFCVLNGGVPVLATRAWDASMLPSGPNQITNVTTITTGTGATAWTNAGNAFNGTVNQTQANSASLAPSNNSQGNCLGQDWGVGNAQTVTQVVLTSPTNNGIRGDLTNSLAVFTYVSSDNTNWRVIDTRNINASTSNTQYTFPINIAYWAPYRYVRTCIAGNGTNGIFVSQLQYYTTTSPSTRRLARYNGVLTNDALMTARISSSTTLSVAANQGTYLGSIHTDAATAGQVSINFGFGSSRVVGLWNYYQRKKLTLQAGSPLTVTGTTGFSYNLAWPANGDWSAIQSQSGTFSAQILVGYADAAVEARMPRIVYLTDASGNGGYEAGIGVDVTTGFSGTEWSTVLDTTGQDLGTHGTPTVTVPPFFGLHTFNGVEKLSYNPGGGPISLFTDIRNSAIYVSTEY